MRQIGILFRMNLKLLLRNKGFLVFLVILPILSLYLLNVKETELTQYGEGSTQTINHLAKAKNKVIYNAKGNEYYYTIKVYDSSDSELSDYVLQKLLDTGMVYICYYDSQNMTEEEIEGQIKVDINSDRIGSILYFLPEFEQEILAGKLKDSVVIYRSSDDERRELVEESFGGQVSILLTLAEHAGGEKEALMKILQQREEVLPKKTIRQVSNSETLSLTAAQKIYKQHIGYSFSFFTLSSLFCGVFIAYTVIEERDNRILRRMIMGKTDAIQYIVSKLLISVFVSVMQTVIIAIGIFFVIKPEYGISGGAYLFLIFMLGMIFNTMSLCVGVVLGNVMSANYTVFTIWSISSLLAGLYFDVESSSGLFRNLSHLMPQKWFLKAYEMFLQEDGHAVSMVLCVTVAFLLIMLSVGAAGLKLKQEDY